MNKKQNNKPVSLLFGALAVLLVSVLIFCLFMIDTINRRMNESAASNLLSTTRVIQNTLESYLNKDLESLNIISDLYKSRGYLECEQIDALCDTMGFDWVALVDAQGNGVDCFAGKFQASDLPCYAQWSPENTGYSDAYIGQSGRPQITLWQPIYREGQYVGTVFGSVILMKYYSADVFTFYDGAGRAYLFDSADGAWILKSLGTDGASVRQNDIYALFSASGNKEEEILAFQQAVENRQGGTAVMNFNGEQAYFCFLPLSSSPGWYITTVIAKDVLLKEAAEVQRMIHWVLAVLCGAVVCAAGAFMLWRLRKTKMKEARYRELLFANISANLDSAFLIYERNSKRKAVFVSDNIKRLLGLNRKWIGEDAGRLFSWCGIPEEDLQRTAFLEGSLDKPAVREVCVENELGEKNRTIRLELIPADMGQTIAVLTDITKSKEIQDSLIETMQHAEAASNAKNEFLSAMSHDLRTPINGIVGMTAIAAAHLEDKHRVRDCLTKISESTAHLLDLINEVLDMSQIESGKITLVHESFNIAELLQNVLNVNYPGIQQKSHQVNVHVDLMEHENVIGDPARLTRITANLISNAIKYTPSGGTISLTLREKEPMIQGYGCYELTVQDNGIGMSEAFQERLFEPFEREEDVRLSRIQGTGLGLPIVKNIVDLMMGSIQVQSKKGEGSTFCVTVNLQLDIREEKRDAKLTDLPVLVVDDDTTACRTVSAILCNIGMKGEWTDSGFKAVEMVAGRHEKGADYFAVLLDWKMPGMDGLETARRIRAEVDEQVPIIILTAFDWSEIETEAKEAGVNAFFSKPIYKAKLAQKMTEIAEGHLETFDKLLPACAAEIPPGKRVLLAEDNALNREIAVEILRMMGVETDCAEDGAEAVERFAGSEPGTYATVLMDIQMPRLNGYEATEKIRKLDHPDACTVPIIAMTADAFKKDERAAREAGMNEHLAKPISIERLAQVLKRFL